MFAGGVVAYSPAVKAGVLGIDPTVIEAHGQVSAEVSLAMAAAVKAHLGCDVGAAVTGSAGPDALEEPPGTSWVAVDTPEDARARMLRMPGDRERVRTYTTTAVLHLTRLAVSGDWWP